MRDKGSEETGGRQVDDPATMRTEGEIRALIAAIEADSRCPEHAGGKRRAATVDINAPLALQQIGMSAARSALLWVLGGEYHGLGIEEPATSELEQRPPSVYRMIENRRSKP